MRGSRFPGRRLHVLVSIVSQIAATNDHKLSGFEQHKCILLPFLRSEVLKGVQRAAFLLEALGENQILCLFYLSEATCISWLRTHPPPSKPAA